jgi:hypothetical protein
VAFGHPLQVAEQEVIDALPKAVFIDFQPGDRFFA